MSLENVASIAAQVATAMGQPPPAGTPPQPITPPPVVTSPVATTTTPQTTAAPVMAAAPPVGITLTAEQWAAYTNTQSRIAELEGIERQRAVDAQAAEVKALQAKGQIEQAFALQREQARLELESERKRLKDTEDRAKRYALDGELARSLASQPLVAGGAEQLTQLWRNQFSVEPQGDSFAVQAPGFQPVGSWIAAQLGRPEYAHFLRAQNPGGGTQVGAQGTQGTPTTPSQIAAPVMPKNMSEAIMMQIAAQQRSTANPLMTGATLEQADGSVARQPALGFGLRPQQKADSQALLDQLRALTAHR